MTIKKSFLREMYVIAHGQSARFRIVKYCIMIAASVAVGMWKGGIVVAELLFSLAMLGICLHFFFRWKTKAWTQPWGLYKKVVQK